MWKVPRMWASSQTRPSLQRFLSFLWASSQWDIPEPPWGHDQVDSSYPDGIKGEAIATSLGSSRWVGVVTSAYQVTEFSTHPGDWPPCKGSSFITAYFCLLLLIMTQSSWVPLASQAREDCFLAWSPLLPRVPTSYCQVSRSSETTAPWLCSADSLLRRKQLTLLFVSSKLSNVLLCVFTWHKSLLCTSQLDPGGPWQNNCMAVDEGLHSNNCFIWKLYCFPSVAEALLCPKSWCFTFALSKRWEILEPHIHPREDPQSNFRRLNLKSRLHPSRLHIWLSRCLHDGLLYCLNSCVASNAANLCHCADLLLSVHATAGEYPSEMNAGLFFLSSETLVFVFSLSQSHCRAEELREEKFAVH